MKGQASGLFDTLILLVDKAGLKDKLNQQGVSFFAPTDYAINNYLNRRAIQEQNIDPLRKWTLDSLIKYEMPKFTDSLDTYFVGQTWILITSPIMGLSIPPRKQVQKLWYRTKK